MNRFFPRISRLHCPNDEQLAAYADQQLIGVERQRVESHLAGCDACLAQVGFLVRQSTSAPSEASVWLVEKAAQLRTEPRPNIAFGWKWAPIAASVVAVAAGVILWLTREPTQPATTSVIASAPASSSHTDNQLVPTTPDTAVRSAGSHPSAPTILSPHPGAIVDSAEPTFRWAPLANAASYQLRIVTSAGDLIWEQKVAGTSLAAPPNVVLKKGTKYFVWVRAVFPDGKTQQSEPVGFTVE